MERLTSENNYCIHSGCSACAGFQSIGCDEEKIYNKLQEYEDLEEQGLLLRLPCKVGTKVYYIAQHNTISLDKGVIYEGDVTRAYALEEETCITMKIHTGYGVTEISNITEFGKTVFLTKAEAEKKLAEMEK